MSKVGDRIGLAEIIGITKESFKYVCNCGTTFSKRKRDCNGHPKGCSECVRDGRTSNIEVRPYTDKELKMIEKFENGRT